MRDDGRCGKRRRKEGSDNEMHCTTVGLVQTDDIGYCLYEKTVSNGRIQSPPHSPLQHG